MCLGVVDTMVMLGDGQSVTVTGVMGPQGAHMGSPHPAPPSTPLPVLALQGDQSDITRNVDTWKDTTETRRRGGWRSSRRPAPGPGCRTLSRKAPPSHGT